MFRFFYLFFFGNFYPRRFDYFSEIPENPIYSIECDPVESVELNLKLTRNLSQNQKPEISTENFDQSKWFYQNNTFLSKYPNSISNQRLR